jgi:predicted aspartyl protease
MSLRFDPRQGLSVVPTELTGPSGSAVLRLALDTGATTTLVNAGLLVAIGCDPAHSTETVEVTTGSGLEYAPRVKLLRILALGESRTSFPVLAHTLPPSAGVDGLLGLDFLRGKTLTVDLREGELTLT